MNSAELCFSLCCSYCVNMRVKQVSSACKVKVWSAKLVRDRSICIECQSDAMATDSRCRGDGLQNVRYVSRACTSWHARDEMCVTWLSLSIELSGRLRRHLGARGRGFENPPLRAANVHLILFFSSDPRSLPSFFVMGDVIDPKRFGAPPTFWSQIFWSQICQPRVLWPHQITITLFWTLSTSKMHLHLFLIMPYILYYRCHSVLFSFHMYCIFI